MKSFLSALFILFYGSLIPQTLLADTFVLVHGGWGNGATYKAVEKLLVEQGHTVFRPTLTGLGERKHLARPDTSLETHIQDIINHFTYEELSNVVLVGHSYGGMVITGVADRIPERISRLVYIEGMVPSDGESMLDIHKRAARNFDRLHRGDVIVHPKYRPGAPYPNPVPQPVRTVTDKIHLSGAAAKIPTTFILTVDKGAKAEHDPFYPQAERARKHGWPIAQITGDHNIQVSNPNLWVKAVIAAYKSPFESQPLTDDED